jgi:hypothetical protein
MARPSKKNSGSQRIIRDFNKHATALGLACISWSLLEDVVGDTLAELIPLEHEDGADIAGAVNANVDFRSKLQVLLAVGFVRKPGDNWFYELEHLINRIDNELRPERNRYVHDVWRIDLGEAQAEIVRITRGSKLKRPQAFQMELVTKTETPIIWEELESLSRRISEATSALLTLAREFSQLWDERERRYPSHIDEP